MGLRDKAKSAKIIEEQNIYLTQPEKGLNLCANIISIGTAKHQNMLDKIDEILSKFMEITQENNNIQGVKTYAESVKNSVSATKSNT